MPKPRKKDDNSASTYWLICLISEVGKIFEKIITERIWQHLNRIGPNISDRQYGFRRGRSAVDAINLVMNIAKDIVSKGGVAMAVSINIANAFNSLLWGKIHAALVRHRIPVYIRRVVQDYLKDRVILYNVGNHLPPIKRFIERRVP